MAEKIRGLVLDMLKIEGFSLLICLFRMITKLS